MIQIYNLIVQYKVFTLYSSVRDPNDTISQVKCAACSSTAAMIAEVPFDHAKRHMMGSTRVMVGAGLLYVPFATLMLVLYDKAAVKFVKRVLNEEF